MPKERGMLQLFNMPRPGPQTRSPEEAPELRSSLVLLKFVTLGPMSVLCPFGLAQVWPASAHWCYRAAPTYYV